MSLGLKILSEKFMLENKDNIKNSHTLTIGQINENLNSNYNRMKSIKEQVEDIKAQWKALQEDADCFSFAKTIYQGASVKEGFQKAIDDLKLEFEDARNNYNFYKNLKNKYLTEAEETIAPPDASLIDVEDMVVDSSSNTSTSTIDNTSSEINSDNYNYII